MLPTGIKKFKKTLKKATAPHARRPAATRTHRRPPAHPPPAPASASASARLPTPVATARLHSTPPSPASALPPHRWRPTSPSPTSTPPRTADAAPLTPLHPHPPVPLH